MTTAGPEQTAEQPAVPTGTTSPARVHEAGTTSTTGTAGPEQPTGATGAAIADQSGGSPGPASTAGRAQARGCSRASCPAVADQPSTRSAVLSGAWRTGDTIADQRAVGERLEGVSADVHAHFASEPCLGRPVAAV